MCVEFVSFSQGILSEGMSYLYLAEGGVDGSSARSESRDKVVGAVDGREGGVEVFRRQHCFQGNILDG